MCRQYRQHARAVEKPKAIELILAGELYRMCLKAQPPMNGWFSIPDMVCRFCLATGAFYYFLLTEPFKLARFTWSWNCQWYGYMIGTFIMCYFPVFPFFICFVEVCKRLNDAFNPFVKLDWKLQGPGRVFFVRPRTLIASLAWDFYLALSNFCGSFMQYGTSRDGLRHTMYDHICTKDYWISLFDRAGVRRPMQLARWDSGQLTELGPGITSGNTDLVCKITDSFLGIGDKVLKRGRDFSCAADVCALLASDTQYDGREAIIAEYISPPTAFKLSSPGYSNVHSLDILTIRTKHGVRVLSVLLWTDCNDWSSHSSQAGYLCDIETETVMSPAAWYAPYFAQQRSTILGMKLPGLQAACSEAIKAHEASDLPWLTAVGWDAMLSDDAQAIFFEGNVACYRLPRRIFLTFSLLRLFLSQFRGAGSPVPGYDH